MTEQRFRRPGCFRFALAAALGRLPFLWVPFCSYLDTALRKTANCGALFSLVAVQGASVPPAWASPCQFPLLLTWG